MRSAPGGPQWRGWDQTRSGRVGLVTSARLGGDAPVQNRMFPKVRSWFALGAPLELLSPLSVIRIVLLVVVAGAVALGSTVPGAGRVLVAGVVIAGVLVLVLLTGARELAARQCGRLAAGTTIGVAAVVVAAGGGDGGAASLLLLVPVAIFVGLFLTGRTIVLVQALTAGGVATAFLLAGTAWATIIAVTLLTVVTTTITAAIVALAASSARTRATVDADTGIPNGYGFAESLTRHTDRVVVAVLDLGGLVEAREALGHRAGTELLRRAVEDLGQVLPAGAAIGRVDGDRLVVSQLLPDGGTDVARDGARDLADHLAEGLGAGRYLVDEIEVTLRPHIGYAIRPLDGIDATELIRCASLAADRARSSGHEVTRWETSMVGAMTSSDLALLADLRLAADRDELSLAYQPQVDPVSGTTVAVEALLRWSNPVHGTVGPDRFVPLAERTGLVDRLTEWVLAEALDAQVRWRRAGLDLPVSVNVSAGSLSDPGFPETVLRHLRERRLPGAALTVEVTETAALDAEQAADRLGALHDAGVGVSIDDFGTGYTSLAVLPNLPVDELKVDQRFVRASATSPADDSIVRSVLELAHQLGMRAVAEGVENAETSDRIAGYGFDLLQGWAFSKALPEAELVDFVCSDPYAARSLTASRGVDTREARHQAEVSEPR